MKRMIDAMRRLGVELFVRGVEFYAVWSLRRHLRRHPEQDLVE
jgi:hypothetical protein